MEFRMNTGTATLAIFDPACLSHRRGDADDWWSVPREELIELNAGNLCLVALDEDGEFDVDVGVGELDGLGPNVESLVRCRSRIYVGPGEDVVAFEMGPDEMRHPGGRFVELPEGLYRVRVCRPERLRLLVRFEVNGGLVIGLHEEPLFLGSPAIPVGQV